MTRNGSSNALLCTNIRPTATLPTIDVYTVHVLTKYGMGPPIICTASELESTYRGYGIEFDLRPLEVRK